MIWRTSGKLDSSERTIAILGDGWCPQAAKREGDKISMHGKGRFERPNVGGVSYQE